MTLAPEPLPGDLSAPTGQQVAEQAGPGKIQGRSLRQIAWRRLRRDNLSIEQVLPRLGTIHLADGACWPEWVCCSAPG